MATFSVRDKGNIAQQAPAVGRALDDLISKISAMQTQIDALTARVSALEKKAG